MKKTLSFFLFVLVVLLSFASCSGPTDDRTVLTIDGYKVCYDEYRYFYMNSAVALKEKGVTDLTDETILEQIRTETLDILKRNCAIRNLAKKYKFTLDREDKKILSEQYEDIRANYETKDSFLQGLSEVYLTDYEFRQVQEITYLWQKLFDCMTNEANFIIQADNQTVLADIPQNFYHGLQILIANDKEEDPAENQRKAEAALESLENGASLTVLLAEYGEDPGSANGIGYYFTSGELLPYFEEAVKGLNEGEHTGVIDAENGYAIVFRETITDEYVQSHMEDFRVRYSARRFNEILQEEMDRLSYQTNKLYYELTPAVMGLNDTAVIAKSKM